MKPSEVPDELLNLAVMVRLEYNPDGSREDLAHFLAGVLRAHEAKVMRDVTVKQWGDTLEAIVNDSVNERLADLERDVRAKIAAEMQPIWDDAVRTSTAYGTTYAVDAVGKCIQIARGEKP